MLLLQEIHLNSLAVTPAKVASNLWKCLNKKKDSRKSKKRTARNTLVKKVVSDLLNRIRQLKSSLLPLSLLDSAIKRLARLVATLSLFRSLKSISSKKKLWEELKKDLRLPQLNKLNKLPLLILPLLKDLSEELQFPNLSPSPPLIQLCRDQDLWTPRLKRLIIQLHFNKPQTLLKLPSQPKNNNRLLRLKFNKLKKLLLSLLLDSWMLLSKPKDLTLSPLRLKKSTLLIRSISQRNKNKLKIKKKLNKSKTTKVKTRLMKMDSLLLKIRNTLQIIEEIVEESLVLLIRRSKTS